MSPASSPHTVTELEIDGMTCASCVAHVRKALASVPGVEDARVNLATEHATVEHAPSTAAEALIAAVRASGYEARLPSAPDADAAERDRALAVRRRVLVLGIALFVPSLVLGMSVGAFPGKDWLMLALAVPAWAIVGAEFHRGAIAQLRHGAANMDTLVSLGSTVALVYSIYATLTMRPAYYETAVAIVVLIYLGKYLETVARGRTNLALRKLLALRPAVATLVRPDGSTAQVTVDSLQMDDIVVVAPGERVPTDGVVLAGSSAIDASMITGESRPRRVEPGASIFGGTVNGEGELRVRTSAVGEGTMLARIVRLVQDAQSSQAPVQRLADSIAAVFVPAILAVAALTFAGWTVSGHGWTDALIAAVAVIVVACPCAMGLATPIAVIVGVGEGARRGILFKDAEALERAGTLTTIVFDKTGTLTAGKPAVVRTDAAPGASRTEVLATAAAVESASSHPIARAIADAAARAGAPVPSASGNRAFPGLGVGASVDGSPGFVGSARLMAAHGVPILDDARASDVDATRVYVALGNRYLGSIDVADAIRDEAQAAVDGLRARALNVALVSGDETDVVKAVATRLGIPRFQAQAFPDEKAAFVRSLRDRGERVGFVGDGINDAPALAVADSGLAMGSGAEIAIEAADAAIISNDPRAVGTAISLSRAATRTIRQNLFWAFAYNIVLVPLAAFGIVHPIFAAAAMGLSSIFVVGNSLLLPRRAGPWPM